MWAALWFCTQSPRFYIKPAAFRQHHMIFFCGARRALKKTKSSDHTYSDIGTKYESTGGWVERSGCKFVSDSDRAAARWKFTQMVPIASHLTQPNCNNEGVGELCDKSNFNPSKTA
jgi:hypothetical protein